MGFAGMKDKSAVTRQWICVSNKTPEELQGLGEQLHHVTIMKVVPNEKNYALANWSEISSS